MPRLSIVLPTITFDPLVEQTLVSVLQNRPEYSEVIVVTSQPYDDPYELGREVRFLTDANSATRLELINHGCAEARGNVIHLLLPGVLAVDGWTDRVLQHFTDKQVAAVAPMLMPNSGRSRAVACGVDYSASGNRRFVGAGTDPHGHGMKSVLAPTLAAGFFRHETLSALQGFDCQFGESLADIELGMALRDLGLKTIVEPHSRVIVNQSVPSMPRNYEEARQAEYLFRRHTDKSTSLGHVLSSAAEFVCGFPHIRMLTRLCGRLAAHRESDPKPHYQARLERARTELQRARDNVSTIPGGFEFGTSRRRSAA